MILFIILNQYELLISQHVYMRAIIAISFHPSCPSPSSEISGLSISILHLSTTPLPPTTPRENRETGRWENEEMGKGGEGERWFGFGMSNLFPVRTSSDLFGLLTDRQVGQIRTTYASVSRAA